MKNNTTEEWLLLVSSVIIAMSLQWLMIYLGEPRSVWFFCDMMKIC